MNAIRNSWTPAASYATVGSSTWAPSTQEGRILEMNGLIVVMFRYIGVPTNGTGAGNLQITGCPIPNGAAMPVRGKLSWGGITNATYTEIAIACAAGSATFLCTASGSGIAPSSVQASDVPSGGTVNLSGMIILS